ncbi:MAG: hypothetical protein JWP88_2238 [Flaviaesturariibacter sp.]|nr:hypothetical protein [Flaviaesturariibacter sp.]
MEIHLKIIGILLIGLALLHFVFPRYFNWKEELVPLSLINRQVMYVHTLFIALAVFLIGVLCLASSHEMVTTHFGKRVAFGLGVFWTARLIVQFFGYSSELWRGKSFETAVHVLFSILWTYISVIFVLVYLG